ncbi:MAG: preprotein translocase subunit SecG [Solirubrobacterales bacterium]|nr:preprotein translocase subunit SecG [Thermoleophilaceae bacterium]MBA3861722.1 preprotein translocase subunit SecG [Solirubrobacterales bacterium]
MVAAFSVTQVLLSVLLIVLVLLHSGKDAGLSGAFGVGATGSSLGAGPLLERNLTRYTILTAALFVVNVVVLLKI